MDTVERIKSICKERGIAISRLERECGFSNGYIRSLREGMMPADRLFKVAQYRGLTPEYLMSGEHPVEYHFDPETAKIAQEIYDNPDLHFFFDSMRDTSPKNIKLLKEFLTVLKESEEGSSDDPA